MNKSELVEKIAEGEYISKASANRALDSLIGSAMCSLHTNIEHQSVAR
jgi:DNA-binding protein HU-beta